MANWHGVRKHEQLPARRFNDFNQMYKSNCGQFPGHDFVVTTQFMHGGWWYLVNGSWHPEATIETVN